MSAGDELTCAQLVELVTEYLEDALATADARRFEAHVQDCAHCARFVGQMQLTIRALRDTTVPEL